MGFDDLFREGGALTWQSGKVDVVRQVAEVLMDLGPDSRVLDFGCGIGWTAPILTASGGRYFGVDPSHDGIEIATRDYARPGRVRFQRIAIDESLRDALHGARFTHVFALDALYFARDLEATLEALLDAVEEGGTLTAVHHIYRESRVADSLLDAITAEYGYVHCLSGVQWHTLLARTGWRDIRRYRFHDRDPFDPKGLVGHPAESVRLARELYEREGALVLTARNVMR